MTAKKSAKKNVSYPPSAPPEFTPREMPTTTEIAALAIPLIEGDKQDPKNFKNAVIRAIWLWDEAHRQLPELREKLYRRHAIKELAADLPSLAREWPKDGEDEKETVPYVDGLASMFPRDKKDRRDGLMLELLTYMASGTASGKDLGRTNWQRLKKQGFTSHEFRSISYSLAEWRNRRKSISSRENARKRPEKK